MSQDKEKKETKPRWLNSQKTLIEIPNPQNLYKIYDKLNAFHGKVMGSLESCFKDKKIILQVPENGKTNLRDIANVVYFAELDRARLSASEGVLSNSITKGTKADIKDAEMRYGISYIMNAEFLKDEKIEASFAKSFESFVNKYPDRTDAINTLEKKFQSQLKGIESAVALLSKHNLLQINEDGSKKISMSSYEKTELAGVVNSEYVPLDDKTMKKIISTAGDKKEVNEKALEYAKQQKADTQTVPEVKETSSDMKQKSNKAR